MKPKPWIKIPLDPKNLKYSYGQQEIYDYSCLIAIILNMALITMIVLFGLLIGNLLF